VNRTTPVRVGGDRVFGSIAAGAYHTCAASPEGAGFCWGRDLTKSLVDALSEPSVRPAAVGNAAFKSLRNQ
jgi:hypothetical protein